MTGREIYKIWAPYGAKWTDWVRPVPYISIDNEDFEIYELSEFLIPKINYVDELKKDTAIIVDLPGNDSIKEGIALAKIGFRPVPIYNGTNEQEGAIPTVNNHEIEVGLINGAFELQKTNIIDNAPPVFLLDTNRMHRYKMNSSVFDNSWDIYDQDMPTAEYFLNNGIDKIIVRSERKIQKDLDKILYKFQKKGIHIFQVEDDESIKEIKLKKSKYIN